MFQGIALRMLKHYIEHVRKTETDVNKILLICKAHLIPLYTKAGLTLVGPSDVIHGSVKIWAVSSY